MLALSKIRFRFLLFDVGKRIFFNSFVQENYLFSNLLLVALKNMQLMSKCENFPYLNKVRQVLQFYFMQATWNLERKKKKIDVLWKSLQY